MIYLDHAATTPVPRPVADAMYQVLTEQFGNPSSQYPLGREAKALVEEGRAVVAGALGCRPENLHFTSCGTESDNWAISAAVWQGRHTGRHLITTAVAVTLGLVAANLLQVGAGYTLSGEALTYEATEPLNVMDTIVNIFPSNAFQPLADATMLQVIVIALFLGFGIIAVGEKGKVAKDVVDSFAEVSFKIMAMILKVSPIGVFALICPVVAANGPSVLLPLLKVILVAYVAYVAHMALTYSLAVRGFAKMSPLKFFRAMGEPILFAFSSASSVGTLPFNMDATEKLGARKEVSSFVLPLGATINMDGTAIYQGVCAIFIAQIFGIDLTIQQQLIIVLTTVLASIGTAGVPGSGMIMLAMVLTSVGLPVEGIALVAGVDRILDMMRTALNITGDSACCICIDSMDKRKRQKKSQKAQA